jgi:PPOX class probable F420-dependent enzyme
MMTISDERYIAFTTYRKNGEGVTTPVWINPVSDGRIAFTTSMGTGKTKRLKNNPKVAVQPSNFRGAVKPGSVAVSGTAEMVQSGPLYDEVQRSSKRMYGWQVAASRFVENILMRSGHTFADTVVLIRLDA